MVWYHHTIPYHTIANNRRHLPNVPAVDTTCLESCDLPNKPQERDTARSRGTDGDTQRHVPTRASVRKAIHSASYIVDGGLGLPPRVSVYLQICSNYSE